MTASYLRSQALPTLIQNLRQNSVCSLSCLLLTGIAATASAQITIDNSATETDGTWSTSTSRPDYYGSNYAYNTTGSGADKMRWRPTITTSGAYTVSVWLPDGDTSRSINAPYTVYYSGGSQTFIVNEQGPGGKWIDLGIFDFDAGTNGYVELTDNASNSYVVADAVRFTPVSQQVIVDNTATETDGVWTTSNSQPREYGGNYSFNTTGTGADKMRWRPDLIAGDYEVSIWLPDGDSARPTNAPFTVYDANGSTTYELDEQGLGGYWITLGEHTFNTGTSGYVELTDDANNTYTIGDAVRFQPVRHEVVVENMNAERIGNWADSSNNPYYSGTNYSYTASGTGADVMRWRPTLREGFYDVYIWLPQGSSSRASNAPFTVYGDTGSTTYYVDQDVAGGEWIKLGNHHFAEGSSGYVELTDNANNSYVIADAVRFVPSDAIYYVDPVNGDINNPGTESQPWSTLEAVFTTYKNQIEGGDKIYLLDGYHGNPTIAGGRDSEVVIAAAPGANPTAQRLTFENTTNISVSGMEISPEFIGSTTPAILVSISNNCSYIKVSDCLMYSASDTSSWTATDWNTKASKGMDINGKYCIADNNTILNTSFAIECSGFAEYSKATRNTIDGFSGDGIRGLGDYQEFEYNLIQNGKKTSANHDDGFQSWSGANGNDNTVNGIVVRGNVIISYTDPNQTLKSNIQGIGCFDGFFKDWIVENNIVVTDTYHGLSFYGAIDCLIINNTVVENPIAAFSPSPWLGVFPHKNGTPSSGTIVRNNLVRGIHSTTHSQATVDNHINMGSSYSTYLVDWANFDMHLKSGSPAINAGSTVGAPSYDFEGDARDSQPDVGADEYL